MRTSSTMSEKLGRRNANSKGRKPVSGGVTRCACTVTFCATAISSAASNMKPVWVGEMIFGAFLANKRNLTPTNTSLSGPCWAMATEDEFPLLWEKS